LRLTMGARARLAASALAAVSLLAACGAPEVPPGRQPRFVEPHGPPPRVALVLGSGGPRGFAFVGAIKALEEIGVKPDLIVGTSVGAMVGALYASGMDARRLEKTAYDLNLLEFFEVGALTGASSGRPLQDYVNGQLGNRTLEQLPIAFVVAATRMKDRQLVAFNAGDAGLAVRASSASPGQFEPVRVGSELYVDGDVASPVPIAIARKLGAQVVIAVDVSAYLEDTPDDVPAEWVTGDRKRALWVASAAREADVFLHPNIGYYTGGGETYRRRVAGIAEEYTRRRSPEIRAALARAQAASAARMPSGVASR